MSGDHNMNCSANVADDPGVQGLAQLGRNALERIKELEAENANLRTVMMAAAVEIQEHWDAHCDEEGYGPANLMRRLENGYPAHYGYDAATVVRMERRIKELEQALDVALEALEYVHRTGDTQTFDLCYAEPAITKLKEVRRD